MNSSEYVAATLLRIEERLRQDRETFDQRKEHDALWFSLRLRMGYLATIMLPSIAIVSGYILLSESEFSSTTVTAAGAALFVDVLGLLAAVWKVVLNPGSVTRLEPVVNDELNSGSRPTTSE